MIQIICIFAAIVLAGLSAGILAAVLADDTMKQAAAKKKIKSMYATRNMDELYKKVTEERKKQKITDKIRVSQKFADDISMAGLPISPSEFLILWLGLTLGLMILAYLATKKTLPMAGAGIFGFVIPIFIFKRKKDMRSALFSEQLGDALLTISNSIKSGFSFQQAMSAAAEELPDPIGAEFKRTLREISYGITQEEALKRMYQRTQNEDVRMLASAIAISGKTGGNMSMILQTISKTVKDRITIRQKVKTLSTQGRVSAGIVGFLPIGIIGMLMISNPDYLQPMFTDRRGILMLIVAVCMEIVGFFLMKKITDIEL